MFFLQAIAPVIPYGILAGAAGIIYGKLIGFVMAWSGALAGTLSLYLLAKYFRKGLLKDLFAKKYQLKFGNMNSKTIFLIMVIVRVFPVIPTPIINIGSGLSGVPMGIFVSSSALGMIPWAVAYVALGDYFNRSRDITSTMVILGAILIIIITGAFFLRKRIRILADPEEK
ncbi:deda family inner membrane protein ydjz [hydrocarbon metagenome]|uniref:Deda family inner membrane protein ydjz n=1 Tax=hydrocarbon metagenome TaxID=938273 RepID=A0A0W8E2D3_9ZZZZ